MSVNKTVQVDAKLLEGYKIELKARNHTLFIDQPEAGGGKNEGANPLEFNLFSLAGCCLTIGQIIAKQKRLDIRGLEARAEGDLNTDVFMGKTNSDQAGFQEIRIFLKIDADMSLEEKKAFAEEIEARCPVAENLINPSTVKKVVVE